MYRQSGLLAQRLFSSGLLQNNQASGQRALLANAGALISSSGSSASAVADKEVVSRLPFSTSAAAKFAPSSGSAADLLNGAAAGAPGKGMSLYERVKMFFATRSTAATAVSASARSTAAAAAADVASKESVWKRVAQLVAATAAAIAMAFTPALADAPEPWQWLFQDPATSTAQAIVDLHHDICFFLITIATMVGYFLFTIVKHFHYSNQQYPEKLLHNTTVEVIWTIIPVAIVVAIAIPSLTLIYSMDQHTDRPGLTVKVIGRQWYWSYEMHDHLQHKLLDPDKLVAIAEKSLLKA